MTEDEFFNYYEEIDFIMENEYNNSLFTENDMSKSDYNIFRHHSKVTVKFCMDNNISLNDYVKQYFLIADSNNTEPPTLLKYLNSELRKQKLKIIK